MAHIYHVKTGATVRASKRTEVLEKNYGKRW